jgi:hypothetical protein
MHSARSAHVVPPGEWQDPPQRIAANEKKFKKQELINPRSWLKLLANCIDKFKESTNGS